MKQIFKIIEFLKKLFLFLLIFVSVYCFRTFDTTIKSSDLGCVVQKNLANEINHQIDQKSN